MAAANGSATPGQLVEIILRLRENVQMTEVVSQELLMLPTAAVATKFIDFAKQKEAQNRGNPTTSAAISIAEASGLTVSVSSGSQKHLGSGSSNTSKTKDAVRKPDQRSPIRTPGNNKAAGRREFNKRKRDKDAADRGRTDSAKKNDNAPAARGGAETPSKQTGEVPGSNKSPNTKPDKERPKTPSSGKRAPFKGSGGRR